MVLQNNYSSRTYENTQFHIEPKAHSIRETWPKSVSVLELSFAIIRISRVAVIRRCIGFVVMIDDDEQKQKQSHMRRRG